MADQTWPARPHLENSRPLDWTRIGHDEAAESAIAHLMGVLESSEQRTRSRRPADRERLRATLEAIVLDLFVAAKDDPECYLAYSRRKADYGPAAEHPSASLTSVVQVINFLQNSGYATTKPGSFSRRYNPFGGPDFGSGYRARVRAERLLIDTLEGVFGVTRQSIVPTSALAGRPIRLKVKAPARGAKKSYARFETTPEIQRMAHRVVEGNRLRAGCVFTFEGHRPPKIHLQNVNIYRLFNNANWQEGGRFYGGWWEKLPKTDRRRILIDGEQTVELDYSAHHARLCYAAEGVPLGAATDPYTVEGLDPAIYRNAIKRTFAMLLNMEHGRSPARPAEFKGLFPTPSEYREFVEQIERAFKPISHWLRQGRGLYMQWVDSEIADEVLARLTAERIPCLPVHDSFIVPNSSEAFLRKVMADAYRDVLHRIFKVEALPVITGGG